MCWVVTTNDMGSRDGPDGGAREWGAWAEEEEEDEDAEELLGAEEWDDTDEKVATTGSYLESLA